MLRKVGLNSMGLLWLAGITVCLGSTSLSGSEQGLSGDWMPLGFRGQQQWSFVGRAWQENDEGLILPPADAGSDLLAFYVGKKYSAVEAEFEFRWTMNHCGAGLAVRAQDPSHDYLIHFPNCAQCARASHFWAVSQRWMTAAGWMC